MSAIEKHAAVILGVTRFSETSLIVTLFAQDLGKVAALARGALRKGSPFAGCLEPFAECECLLALKGGREVQTFGGCTLLNYHRAARESALLIPAAETALELIRRTVHDGEPLPRLYRLLTAYLRRLDTEAAASKDHIEKLIWLFILHFLKIMGFAPALNACVKCGDTGLTGRVMLSPLSGGAVCPSCALGVRDGRPLSAAAFAGLQRLAGEGIDTLHAPLEGRDEIRETLRDFLSAHFERDMALNSLCAFYGA
ncbi:MAG: DNA repair protein RecO [Fibrobacterota bacterium]